MSSVFQDLGREINLMNLWLKVSKLESFIAVVSCPFQDSFAVKAYEDQGYKVKEFCIHNLNDGVSKEFRKLKSEYEKLEINYDLKIVSKVEKGLNEIQEKYVPKYKHI